MKTDSVEDEVVAALSELFHEHPAWCEAARTISFESASNVYFAHLPGEVWHLARSAKGSSLEPGKVDDPDFVLRFTPPAVACLKATLGGIGEFAATFFSLVEDRDPERRIDLRIVASIDQLQQHGYFKLIVEAGPKVAAYGLRNGVFSLASLGKIVARVRSTKPQDWEI